MTGAPNWDDALPKRGAERKTSLAKGFHRGFFVGFSGTYAATNTFEKCRLCKGTALDKNGDECFVCGGDGKKHETKIQLKYDFAGCFEKEEVTFSITPAGTLQSGLPKSPSKMYERLRELSGGKTEVDELKEWAKAHFQCRIPVFAMVDDNGRFAGIQLDSSKEERPPAAAPVQQSASDLDVEAAQVIRVIYERAGIDGKTATVKVAEGLRRTIAAGVGLKEVPQRWADFPVDKLREFLARMPATNPKAAREGSDPAPPSEVSAEPANASSAPATAQITEAQLKRVFELIEAHKLRTGQVAYAIDQVTIGRVQRVEDLTETEATALMAELRRVGMGGSYES